MNVLPSKEFTPQRFKDGSQYNAELSKLEELLHTNIKERAAARKRGNTMFVKWLPDEINDNTRGLHVLQVNTFNYQAPSSSNQKGAIAHSKKLAIAATTIYDQWLLARGAVVNDPLCASIFPDVFAAICSVLPRYEFWCTELSRERVSNKPGFSIADVLEENRVLEAAKAVFEAYEYSEKHIIEHLRNSRFARILPFEEGARLSAEDELDPEVMNAAKNLASVSVSKPVSNC